ncbi:MAG: zinc-dependent peptidase [Methylococcales bacterium]|nr:zinc-dependent peptidase [Methylococcales bacterium]
MEYHHHACINSYAATIPAEFFAIISEYFFLYTGDIADPLCRCSSAEPSAAALGIFTIKVPLNCQS